MGSGRRKATRVEYPVDRVVIMLNKYSDRSSLHRVICYWLSDLTREKLIFGPDELMMICRQVKLSLHLFGSAAGRKGSSFSL